MRLAFFFFLFLLSGCSSFKLGGVVYCPAGSSCQFIHVPAPQAAPTPAPAASGTAA